MIKFHIEHLDGQSIFGWASSDRPGAAPVNVRVSTYTGIKTTKADIYRQHLKDAGIGNGNAGFVVQFGLNERIDPSADVNFECEQEKSAYRISDTLQDFLRKENSDYLFLNTRPTLVRCAIALIIKNEASYLPEWLEYHRLLGVDHFIVFDNESVDDIRDVLDPYVRLGIVTLLAWPNVASAPESAMRAGWIEQDTAYACAVRVLSGRSSWVGFLDIDEFFAFCSGKQDIKDFLDESGLPSLSLFWRLFGSSDIQERPVGLVIENYKKRGTDKSHGLMKVFAKPHEIHSILNAHRISVGTERVSASTTTGLRVRSHEPIAAQYEHACIHHYHTKSRAEYREKVRRGWPKNTDEKNVDWQAHFLHHDTNEIHDETLLPFTEVIKERIADMQQLGEDLPTLPANWLSRFPPTILFNVNIRRTSAGVTELKGYVVDVAEPVKRFEVCFHDGYGKVITRQLCNLPSHDLLTMRIGDGNYGFAVSGFGSLRFVHAMCDQFTWTLDLGRV